MTKIKVMGEVIEVEPNSVEFEMGGPEGGGSLGFDLFLPRSINNKRLVDGWIEKGVDSVELTLASGGVYTLTQPGTCTADFETYPGKIFVVITAKRVREGS